jgi:hypothetical protein
MIAAERKKQRGKRNKFGKTFGKKNNNNNNNNIGRGSRELLYYYTNLPGTSRM